MGWVPAYWSIPAHGDPTCIPPLAPKCTRKVCLLYASSFLLGSFFIWDVHSIQTVESLLRVAFYVPALYSPRLSQLKLCNLLHSAELGNKAKTVHVYIAFTS